MRRSDDKTLLVTAPPGYGKTSLLTEWAAQDERPFGWLTLGERHNDPVQLLTSVLFALNAMEPLEDDFAAPWAPVGNSPETGDPSSLLERVTTVVASMGTSRQAGVLVFDDLHTVVSSDALRVVASISAAMPSCAKLALASRTRPSLALGRLRAEHALLEFGVCDLAMTEYEAHRLVLRTGQKLTRQALERLVARTEGWPAGLYLASLSLGNIVDPLRDDEVAGSHTAICEYVTEEVLSPLSSDQREFLRRTSVLGQLSAGACDHVLQRSDSGRILQQLAARNLMVMPLQAGSTSYRCHNLLREVLLAELRLEDPTAEHALHRRASDWFTGRDDVDRAIHHAILAGDADRVGEALWEHAAESLTRETSNGSVRCWLERFSDEKIASSVPLALTAAQCRLWEGDLAGAEHWGRIASETLNLDSVEQRRASLVAGVALIEAATAREGIASMHEDAERACELLGEASAWRVLGCLLGGVALYLAGEDSSARAQLDEGVHSSAEAVPLVEALCLAQLALINVGEEDWERALDRASLATERVASHALGAHPLAALVFAASAWIAGHNGHAEDAKRDLSAANRLVSMLGGFMPWYEVETRVAMARAAIQLADVTGARALLSQASRFARRMPEVPRFRAWLDDGWTAIDDLSAAAVGGPGALTIAELRIVRFLPTHLSFREIGERLHVSTNTVKSQAHSVYGKLGATSRSQAVAQADALGLIEATIV